MEESPSPRERERHHCVCAYNYNYHYVSVPSRTNGNGFLLSCLGVKGVIHYRVGSPEVGESVLGDAISNEYGIP